MTSKRNGQFHIFSTLQELSEAAAKYVSRISAQAITERGLFTVALSGGSLPKLLCTPLVAEPLRSQIDWSGWQVFWADERWVPLTHPDSNYRSAREYLFDHVAIPQERIHAVDPTLPCAQAADSYQDKLQQIFERDSNQLPHFDLILLGMGEDGHTASLFPNHPLLHETERWVAPIFDSPKPPPERITLTLPVINNARHIAFIAAGTGKAEVLSEIMASTIPTNKFPAQLVQPVGEGELNWFVDAAAAAKPMQ